MSDYEDYRNARWADKRHFEWTASHGFRRISHFGPPHDFQMFERQKASLEGAGKVIDEFGRVVRKTVKM